MYVRVQVYSNGAIHTDTASAMHLDIHCTYYYSFPNTDAENKHDHMCPVMRKRETNLRSLCISEINNRKITAELWISNCATTNSCQSLCMEILSPFKLLSFYGCLTVWKSKTLRKAI